LTGLSAASYQSMGQSVVPGVFITDGHGHTYNPGSIGFDPSTFEAHFQMMQRLPAGNYELHLSGSQGLTNLTGAPLVGNSSSGDYVVHFSVDRNDAGTNGDPTLWTHDPRNDQDGVAQHLGALFPVELGGSGVNLVRTLRNVGRQP